MLDQHSDAHLGGEIREIIIARHTEARGHGTAGERRSSRLERSGVLQRGDRHCGDHGGGEGGHLDQKETLKK